MREDAAAQTGASEPSPVLSCAGEFLNYMAIEKGASVNTVDAYRRVLRSYVEFLEPGGAREPDDITREEVTRFVASLSSPEGRSLSPRSVAQATSVLRMFHRFAVVEGYATVDPTTLLPSVRMPHRLPRALSQEQVNKLLSSPQGGGALAVRDRLILEMLYATGMRISELTTLDMGDLDLAEKVVRAHGKGDKWRLIPFGNAAECAAKVYLRDARPELARKSYSQALVLNARGGRLTRQGCWKIIKGRARDAGLEDLVTPHGLRHTFATHMLEGGASLLVVQELLGHVSVATTQIYTEVTRDHLKTVYARFHPRA
ncbi:MAG: tyrosine recombinase [Candidatus Anoxymicrobium japonicum]|uniref:Tyrosine recombinase XerC n=1 Tax=Candidatus Anoxymicrobium japonicum TaxID=2013648 RepID=A0A2N3G618_9ACTN|nr:MAG: tyrosine recombinase [Candidatus Anoxymicrobium japonicum]